MKKILIINGANLNLLGKREEKQYGSFTYEELLSYYRSLEDIYNVKIEAFQSNIEGEIVDKIQKADNYDALIVNPAGYTHTSVVILDVLLTLEIPIVEIHISNIHKRESFRNVSITARATNGVIAGLGKEGYGLAVKYLAEIIK